MGTEIRGAQISDGTITTADIDATAIAEFAKVKVTTDDSTTGFLTAKLSGQQGLVVSTNGAAGTSQQTYLYAPIIPLSLFGDASDGSATLDGTATVGWASKVGSVYTMNREAYLLNLTINSGVTLIVNGYLPFIKGTLTNAGIYGTTGNDASGITAGAAITNLGTWNYSAGAGGNGAAAITNAGANGSGSGLNSIGGSGGAGGSAGAGAGGGTGNTTVAPVVAVTGWKDVGFFIRRRVFNVAAVQSLNGSGGGGGGGAFGTAPDTATGGGGGGAAPPCYVFCNILDNTGGVIQSKGGAGGNATSTGAAKGGGGGGGAGGGVIVAANRIVNSGTIQSVGGAGGSPAGGGTTGSAGTASTTVITINGA